MTGLQSRRAVSGLGRGARESECLHAALLQCEGTVGSIQGWKGGKSCRRERGVEKTVAVAKNRQWQRGNRTKVQYPTKRTAE